MANNCKSDPWLPAPQQALQSKADMRESSSVDAAPAGFLSETQTKFRGTCNQLSSNARQARASHPKPLSVLWGPLSPPPRPVSAPPMKMSQHHPFCGLNCSASDHQLAWTVSVSIPIRLHSGRCLEFPRSGWSTQTRDKVGPEEQHFKVSHCLFGQFDPSTSNVYNLAIPLS